MVEDDPAADGFYAQVILVVADHAPLLADPRLARIAAETLAACAPDAPGRLWGYVVLPDMIRLVIGPTDDAALVRFLDTVKARTRARLLETIRQSDGEALDMVLRYNPVWGGLIYRVWQAGGHQQAYRSEYKLSNALYELLRAPVEAGLVEQPDEWPFTWIGGDDV